MFYDKSPFKDAVDSAPISGKSSGKVKYDFTDEVPNTPSRSGGLYPEVCRDTTFADPKLSGPYVKSPFKDAVD
jgi:hypothetical protein